MTESKRNVIPSLETVTVSHFFNTREAVSYDLANQGLVVVTGRNGQGKTAIFMEAVVWLLYGASFEYGAMPGAAVRNRHQDKAAEVTGLIRTQTGLWRVTRRRTKSAGTLSLDFQENGQEEWVGREGTTASVTQETLEKVWGRDQRTFLNSCMFTSDVLRYPDLPDDQKKAIIDRLINAGSLTDAYDRLKDKLTDVEESLQFSRGALQVSLELEEKLLRRIRAVKLERDEFEEEHSGKRERVEKRKRAIEKQLADLPGTIQSDEEALSLSEEALDAATAKASKVRESHATLSVQFERISSSLRAKRGVLNERQRLLAAGNCPTCGSEVEHLEAGLEDLQKKVEALTESTTSLSSVMEKTKGLLGKLTTAEYTQRQRSKALAASLDTDRRALKSLTIELKSLDVLVEEARNPHRETLKKLKERLVEEAGSKGMREEEVKRLQAEAEDLGVLREAFGNRGLRTLLLGNALPFLTERVSEKLTSIGWGTRVELKILTSGKLAVSVDNPEGAAHYHGNSAGERRLVDLALLFSFFEFYAEQNGGYPPQIWFDEAFEKVDTVWQEQLGKLLLGFVEKGVSVIFLSHSASRLEGMADQSWLVEKGVIHKS